MLFKTFRAAVFGIDAYLVEVEVDIGPGQPGIFNVVGLPDKELRGDSEVECSECVRERVLPARAIQAERYAPEKGLYANAQMPPKMIRKYCAISAEGEKLLESAIQRLGLSARAHDRILKVARTIADLEASSGTLDRTYWA